MNEETEQLLPVITNRASRDSVCEALNQLDVLKSKIREAEQELKAQVIAWIKAHGPFTIGTVRKYVGTEKKTKCTDVPAAVQALFVACGGDFELFCQHLASDAIKHGAARKTLPLAEYERLFATEEKQVLKDGKPQQQLLSVDTRFTEDSAA